MRHESQFSSDHEEKSIHEYRVEEGQQELEFSAAEELLRHDASRTPVPPSIGERLRKSVETLPPTAPLPWWKRLFGSGSRP
ncbi:MAG TPA: hypothetical protein VHH88_03040 [Verrucomicrobiae bacterium]|nr:hypothetical protein [Verrucomicrobiae bacterium]